MSQLFDIASFERLKATGNLPSPRGPALAIMRATQNDDISISELARIASGDPAFVARIIRTANGLVGYRQRPIVAVQDAVVTLGLSALRNLALGFSLLSQYKSGAAKGFDYDHYWSASLLAAISMQALAQATQSVPPDESYSLGLLGRIGELALAAVYPEPYGALRAEAATQDRGRLAALERERFQTDHRELGAAMLANWGFPKPFCEAVFAHEEEDSASLALSERTLAIARTLALAQGLAEFCLAQRAVQARSAAALIEAAARSGIDERRLVELGDRIALDWSGWASLLAMPTRSLPPFAELLRPLHEVRSPEPEAAVQPCMPSWPKNARESSRETRLRVLLVVGDEGERKRIREVLEGEGHDVQEAETAVLAAELALLMQPHLLIADAKLADGSGLALVARLRRIRLGRSIHALVLVPVQEDQRVIDAFEAGADDFMTKPVNPRVLLAHLRAAQRVASLHREMEEDREQIRNFTAELAVAHRQILPGAARDALTGLQGRRQFSERLSLEMAAARRHGKSLSCLVVDIDELRVINDTYGRDVGDASVRHVSACLAEGLRASDVVCRAGGDSFLVFCPDSTLADAARVAERVRSLVENGAVSSGRLQLRVTVSIGIAERGETTSSVDAFVEAASDALDSARRAGRNRVGCARPAAA